MTTSTASYIQTNSSAEVALVLLFDGLDIAFTNHSDTTGLSSAYNTATAGQWTTVRGGLSVSGAVERSVRLLDAQIDSSQLSFSILDSSDALSPLMFGEANTSVNAVDLAISIDNDDTFINTIQSPAVFASSSYVYIGTETILVQPGSIVAAPYLASDGMGNSIAVGGFFGALSRGYRSLGKTSVGNGFGTQHLVDTVSGDRPQITDSPRVFFNRMVGLYLCHKVNGTWSGGLPGGSANDPELLWMGRIRTWEEESGSITLGCTEITDKLQTTIGVGPSLWTGELQQGVYLQDRDLELGISVSTFDNVTSNPFFFPKTYASVGSAGYYTHQQLSTAVNNQMGTFALSVPGTYMPSGAFISLDLETNSSTNKLLYRYSSASLSSAGTLDWTVTVSMSRAAYELLGFTSAVTGAGHLTGTLVNGNVFDLRITPDAQAANELSMAWADVSPLKYSLGAPGTQIGVGVALQFQSVSGSFFPQTNMPPFHGLITDATGFLRVDAPGQDPLIIACTTPTSLGGGNWTLFHRGDYTSLFSKSASDAVDNLHAFTGDIRDSDTTSTVKVSQAWIEQGPIGVMMAKLILSTGTVGFNDPNYDTLAPWVGLGIPSNLVDLQSVLGWGDFPYLLFVSGQTQSVKLVESALNTAARQLVFA